MLLCCFREPKKSQKSPNSAVPSSAAGGPNPADAYRKSSQRPLNLSLSSSKEDDNSEILVVHQSQQQHNHQQSHPRGHSICSLTSDRSSRPPSRDGSDRRLEARAPLPKEAKRLRKQKSQESFKENYKSVTSIPYIDATPPSSAGGIGLAGLTNSVTPSHRPYPTASAGKVHLTIGYCIAPKN